LALPVLAKVILRFKRPRFVWYNTFFTNALKRNQKGIKGWIIKKTISSLDAIVCPSNAQRDFLIKEGFDSNKIFFVPNGVDFDFIDRYSRAKSINAVQPFILSIGKDLGRDYTTLIEAIRDIDVLVKIVALPRNFKNISTMPKNVSVLSGVPFLDLLELYKKATIVVIPTKGEDYLGSSDCSGQYVLLDSMAAGKAIIASERETLNDYISSGEEAIIVPSGNPMRLRESILRLIRDRALIKALGDKARERLLKSNLTTKSLAENLAGIFKKVTDMSQD
jgi:glycosyltransferase involved in cell wall biosynthesis